MAALRLGVGDVFTVCKSVVDLCAKATTTNHEEMKDIRILVAEMEAMREHLNVVHTKMDGSGGERGRDGLAPLVTRSLTPIHNDLLTLHQTIQAHHHRKPSVHVLDQARYMLHYKVQLSAFREIMPRHRESIYAIQEVIERECKNSQSPDETSKRKRRESILKLAGLVEREERRMEDESYDQGWVEEAMRFRGGSSGSVIEEEDEDEKDLKVLNGQSTPDRSKIENLKRPLSPVTDGTFLQPFPGAYAQGTLFSKPNFRLDVFDSFSCTNTPRSTPPKEIVDERR